jgi:hypothetical protein
MKNKLEKFLDEEFFLPWKDASSLLIGFTKKKE